ncbi:uncharacterized protein AB675_4415 [Cyphellophora attinorum]|uniref:C3H1-type domain-containing protein n=1 Tax=Cyphellophora attinorum TaxID=1664694 RepID=A0A0N1NZ15_9EURO|nr:uncharacterized protein AB675_4415 [Phialophora attinorum]KPI36607.1 hypothetical protein AB675_4415 [Phialophora attinorum]
MSLRITTTERAALMMGITLQQYEESLDELIQSGTSGSSTAIMGTSALCSAEIPSTSTVPHGLDGDQTQAAQPAKWAKPAIAAPPTVRPYGNLLKKACFFELGGSRCKTPTSCLEYGRVHICRAFAHGTCPHGPEGSLHLGGLHTKTTYCKRGNPMVDCGLQLLPAVGHSAATHPV